MPTEPSNADPREFKSSRLDYFGESVKGLSYLNSLPFSHMAPSSIHYDLERCFFSRST